MNIRNSVFCALTLAAAVLGSSSTALATDTTYGGYGYGAKVDTIVTGLAFLGHSGMLPPTGGVRAKSLLQASVAGVLEAHVLHGAACGSHGKVEALAGVANVHVFHLLPYSLDVDVANAESRVSGTSNGGRSQILGLRFGGLAVTVTGAPNQTIKIPNVATLVINEQKFLVNGSSRRMRVNALRLTVVGVGEIVLGAAEADLDYVTDTNGPCFDFITCCGRLVNTLGKTVDCSLNFGIDELHNIIVKTGCFANGTTKIVLTGCTEYRKINGVSGGRHCEGPCTINGVGGFTYTLDCVDGGDNPANDLCHLHLSDGDDFNGHCQLGQIKLNIPCGTLALGL